MIQVFFQDGQKAILKIINLQLKMQTGYFSSQMMKNQNADLQQITSSLPPSPRKMYGLKHQKR